MCQQSFFLGKKRTIVIERGERGGYGGKGREEKGGAGGKGEGGREGGEGREREEDEREKSLVERKKKVWFSSLFLTKERKKTMTTASEGNCGVGDDTRGVLPNAPHPLGIRPWGSMLLVRGESEQISDEASDGDDAYGGGTDGGDIDDGAEARRQKKRRRCRQRRPDPRLGLGDLRRLPDEALLIVVASLPAKDLAAISCVSRALYAFASAAADGGVEGEDDDDDDGDVDDDAGGENEDDGKAGAENIPKRKKRPGIGGWRSATLSDFGGDWAWGGTWARTYAAAAWARKELEAAKEEQDDEEKEKQAKTKKTFSSPSSSSSSLVAAAERALASPRRLPPRPPKIRVPLFSDALYAPWAAVAADPAPWLRRDTIPRLDEGAASSMSAEEFRRRFDEPAVPVVFVGAAKKWPAFLKWRDGAYLARVLGGGEEGKREGKEGGGKEGEKEKEETNRRPTVHVGGVDVAWRHFIDYAATNADDLPLTVFDSKVLSRRGEELRRDLEPGPPRCLPVAREDSSTSDDDGDGGDDGGGDEKRRRRQQPRRERDLFSVLPKEYRPDHEWLIVGGRRSGSGFHIDPNATSAWNATVVGSKKWVLHPPGGAPPPGVEPSADLSMVTAPAALADWFRGFYDEAFGGDGGGGGDDGGGGDGRCRRRRRRPPPSSSSTSRHPLHRPLEGVVHAGDVVFVPRGWWHAVLNLETPTVAVTANFVSRAGLPAALRWIRSRDALLVSGVRGDAARGELAGRWDRALRDKCPEVLEEAEARIAAEDAALEERRRRERALASLFRGATAGAGEGGGGGAGVRVRGKETAAAAVDDGASAAGGGFAFNFAVED